MRERPLCLFCLLLFLARLCMALAGNFVSSGADTLPKPEFTSQETVSLTGQIYQKESTSDDLKLYLKIHSISNSEHSESLIQAASNFNEKRILVYCDSKQEAAIGNTVRVSGEVALFEPARNPGNFDARAYYRKKGICAMVWADRVEVTDARENQRREALFSLRKQWRCTLLACAGEREGGTLCAILLGERSFMNAEVKEVYQKSGISHILAISGLHIAFLGWGIYRILRRLGGSFVLSGVISSALTGSYLLMTGAQVSAVRAALMFWIAIGAEMTGRVYDGKTGLAVAAAVIAFQSPQYLTDAGFLLSFGAVLGLLFICPVLLDFGAAAREGGKPVHVGRKPARGENADTHREGELPGGRDTFVGKVGASACAGMSVSLVTLPVILYYYYEFPTYAMLLNLIVLPLMSVVLTCGVSGLVLSCVSPWAANIMIRVSAGVLCIFEKLCEGSLRLPFALIVTGRPKIWQIALYYLLLAGVLTALRLRLRRKKRIPVLLLAVPMFLWMVCLIDPQSKTDLEVIFLDVGQGDCTLIRSPKGTTWLVDGGSSDVKDVAKNRIEPYLKYRGIDHLDYVFLTHGDADHINGVSEMLSRKTCGISIRCLILPCEERMDETLWEITEQARGVGCQVFCMGKGQKLVTDGVTFTCLHPPDVGDLESGNESSLVLKVQYGGFRLLLTGDVEQAGEELLCACEEIEDCTVLKVAHHGSRNATGEAFLKKVNPAYAVISSGVGNRYGHPHEETVERLDRQACQIFGTANQGAILLHTDGARMKIQGFLK